MLYDVGNSSMPSMGLRVLCIFFPLVLLAGVVYGGYLIHEAYQDEHSDEVHDLNPVIHAWSTETSLAFSRLNVSIASNTSVIPLELSYTEDWPMLVDDLEPYTGLAFAGNFSFGHLDQVLEQLAEFNNHELVTNLTLQVNSSFFQVTNLVVGQLKHYRFSNSECLQQPSCWDASGKICYSLWLVHTIWLVVNETTLLTTDGTAAHEELEQMTLGSCSLADYANTSFAVQVRSVHDPLVYATSQIGRAHV